MSTSRGPRDEPSGDADGGVPPFDESYGADPPPGPRSHWHRHPGAVAGAVLAAVLLAALAAPLLTDTRRTEPGLRVEEVEDTDDGDEGQAGARPGDETPPGRRGPGPAGITFPTIAWPFERSELVVLTTAETDADDRGALAEELAAKDAAGPARVLSPGEVTARVGEAQAGRLRRRSVGGAILVDVRGGRQAHQASRRVLPTRPPAGVDDASPSESPARPDTDARIAGAVVPGCRELARSAALTGIDHARGLLEDARCGYFDVVAAGPRAEEPWAVVVRLGPTPPHDQLLTRRGEDESGSRARTAPEEATCLEAFTVRAVRGEACRRGQGERLRGLVGTGWQRRPPVLAGLAPESSARVTADGEALTLADGPGGVPVFAGAPAPEDEVVTLRALAGDGRLLDERVVGPADLLGAR